MGERDKFDTWWVSLPSYLTIYKEEEAMAWASWQAALEASEVDKLREAVAKCDTLLSVLVGIASSGFSRDIEGISYSPEFIEARNAVNAARSGNG